MAYIDGLVIPVPAGREADYRAMARDAATVFRDHGALQVVEAFDDDVPHGQRTDLWRAVDATESERLVFAWIVWPDRATRDAGSAKVMEDPRMKLTDDMPLDGKRMIFGGFEIFLDTASS